MWKNNGDCFGLVSISLHWLMALLMIGLFFLGWYMVDLNYTDPDYNLTYTVHKSLGILVFELAILQIGWRCYAKHPAPLGSHKSWEILAARIVHIILFSMIVLIPFSGYAISSAKGQAVGFFELYAIPAVLPEYEGMEDLAGEIHFYLAYVTACLVLLHMAAALKHQFIDKDGTLSRMLGSP
jgi:cytochrome b561